MTLLTFSTYQRYNEADCKYFEIPEVQQTVFGHQVPN